MKTIAIQEYKNRKVSESTIIKRVLSGDNEWFELLMRRNNQKLYRVIRSYINDEVEIEDVMQDTYLRAYEKLYQFKQTSTFSTWLIRIGINVALARLKEKQKVRMINDATANGEKNTILEMPDKHQNNPEKKMIKQEVKQLLEKAIDTLPSQYKTIYILKEVEGMRIKEISACLDLTESNVKVCLHRARVKIKEQLFTSTQDADIFEFGFSRCDRLTDRVMHQIL